MGDTDLDIGVWSEDLGKVDHILDLFRKEGYKVYSESYSGRIYLFTEYLDQSQIHNKIDIKL